MTNVGTNTSEELKRQKKVLRRKKKNQKQLQDTIKEKLQKFF